MNKREFILAGAALSAGSVPGIALAQAPKVGKDYRIVDPAQRSEAPDGKLEVVEFFWYACPHCYSLEPVIEDWASKLPEDVHFRRVHVSFRGNHHQRIFYTLKAMNKTPELDKVVFGAIHRDRKRMRDEEEVADVLEAAGLDRSAFLKTWNSFGVAAQMKKASKQVAAYGIDGVPMLAVNGKYLTAPSMAGSNGRALEVVDALVAMER